MTPPKGLCLVLAGIFILSGCTIAEGLPVRLEIVGRYNYMNTYDGTSWTYDIPITPIIWNITAAFDDAVAGTSETSGPDFLIRGTAFTIPATTSPSPITNDLLAQSPAPIALYYSSAYAEQAYFASSSWGVKRDRVGEGAYTDPYFESDPNISKSFLYTRWVGPEVGGAASGIGGIGDVGYFTSSSLEQFLREALLNGYPVWNSEYIGVSFTNLATGASGWEWAVQYAGSGTLVGVEVIPEPSSLGLLAAGLCGIALAARRRR